MQYRRQVYPRALKNLMQLPLARRIDVIVEGLGLLVEHVATLTDDLAYLAKADRPRGAALLEAQAHEEAAKVLILLDLVRLGWTDHKTATTQVARFYDHLARCIYAQVSMMRPADFGEIRRLVEDMRPSHYLDGPNDVDWIFRNQLLTMREGGLYVDLVQHEEGPAWVTPAGHDRLGLGHNVAIQKLVIALHRLGVTSRRGLEVVAAAWAGQVIDDGTRWATVADINRSVVTQLLEDGAALPDVIPADARRIIDRWTFPLHGLDLREVPVPLEDLRERRERRFASQTW